jgi:hypothetical protein
MKNPLNFLRKANRSFNLYLENFGKKQKFIYDYYKDQKKLQEFVSDYYSDQEDLKKFREEHNESVYKRLYNEFKEKEHIYRAQTVNQMPNVILEEKHVENTRTLLNREHLLERLQKDGICAEVGVAAGDFSEMILQINRPRKFHLVDAWHTERYGNRLENIVKEKFAKEIESRQVILNKGLSTEVLPQFEDNYFDWVYIDTAHDYHTTAQELAICCKKVKEEGMIAGHDFSMGNWIEGYKYGVIEAVYEFCAKYDWEILYLTSELVEKSFAIRELK